MARARGFSTRGFGYQSADGYGSGSFMASNPVVVASAEVIFPTPTSAAFDHSIGGFESIVWNAAGDWTLTTTDDIDEDWFDAQVILHQGGFAPGLGVVAHYIITAPRTIAVAVFDVTGTQVDHHCRITVRYFPH